jgi:hypothetical protein
MSAYVGFLVIWIPFWFGLAGLFLTLWGIALDENSTRYAISYVGDKSVGAFLSRSVSWATRFSNRFFGDRLISFRAFGVGLLISVVVYSISYGIMLVTTPDQLHGVLALRNSWNTTTAPSILHFSIYSDFALAFLSLVAEFIYVLKSRYLLKRLNYDSSLRLVTIILIGDVISTFMVFVVITPMLIAAFGFVFFYLFHSQLQGDITIPNPYNTANLIESLDPSYYVVVNGKPFYPPVATVFSIYPILFENICTQTMEHFREGFSIYHQVDFSVALKTPLPEHPATVEIYGHQVPVESSYAEYNVFYPLSTLLSSAFSTLLWTGTSVLVYVVSKCLYSTINISRVIFLKLHKRPEISLICAAAFFWIGVLGGIAGLCILS